MLTKSLNRKNQSKNFGKKRNLEDVQQLKLYESAIKKEKLSNISCRGTEPETEPASEGAIKPAMDDA